MAGTLHSQPPSFPPPYWGRKSTPQEQKLGALSPEEGKHPSLLFQDQSFIPFLPLSIHSFPLPATVSIQMSMLSQEGGELLSYSIQAAWGLDSAWDGGCGSRQMASPSLCLLLGCQGTPGGAGKNREPICLPLVMLSQDELSSHSACLE